jgi:carbonic anhydrase/acetyltransferase-like protein (isoleucine patch superfamily)
LQEPFFGAIDSRRPQIADGAFIAPAAVVVGRVRIGARSSVWYGSVLRGDDEEIIIGDDTNVQDLSVMHADPGYPAVLGDRVTVGHRAIVHGARVEDDVLIGMGAILLNGAKVGSGSVIAAGAVVTPGAEIPPASLVAGIPAKVLRPVRESDTAMIGHAFESYVRKSGIHREVEALSLREVLAR